MTKSGGGSEGDRQGDDRKSEMAVLLIHALNHRQRRRVLRAVHSRESESCSPVQLAEELGAPLSTVSYHVTVLATCCALEQVGEEPVRGVIEHFYASTVSDHEPTLTLLAETAEADEKVKK